MASSTAQIGVQLPGAAAGLSPKITVRYSSGILDSIGNGQQGSGVGFGWNLDTGGFILRDMKSTASKTDDTFKLIFGGASYELSKVDSANNIYHTKDETFLRVQYFSTGDYWILTTKDGLQHRFGFNADSKMNGLAVDLKTTITWRYFLDEVKTTSGVSIRYSYVKTTAKSGKTGKLYDQAVYPDVITYAYRNNALVGPAREVRFIRGPRGDWKDTTSSTFISLFEKERVDAIEVRVGGSLVRKYAFGFDYSIDRDPGVTWQGGATGDLTLKTVTVLGNDGVSALPSQSFTYNSKRLLDTANNGIDGGVSYTYETIKNIYLNKAENDGLCNGSPFLSDAPGTCFDRVFGYVLKDPAPNTAPLYLVRYYTGDETCGGWEMSYTNTLPGQCAASKIFGYIWTTQTSDSLPIYKVQRDNGDGNCPSPSGLWGLDITTAGTCRSQLYGYARSGKLDYPGSIYDRTRNRVLSRTVSDGLGWSATTNFISYNPSAGGGGFSEFRGYAQVRSIDPLGHYTDNFFLQDDLKKGRPSRIETYSNTVALFSKVVNTWATSTPFSGVTLVSLSRVDKYKCDGQPTCIQTAQTFTYDTNGNPTQTTYLGDVSVTGDERTEKTDWSIDSAN